MTTSLTPKHLPSPASQIGAAFKKARTDAGLSRAAASAKIGVDAQTILRWEHEGVVVRAELESVLRAESVYGVPLIGMVRERLGIEVPRGTSALPLELRGTIGVGETFPFRLLMGRPAIRARINEIEGELIEAGADEASQENVMRTIKDRNLIARFAGGSTDDSYTEAQLLQAINNVAEAAMRFIKGPRV